MATEMTVSSLNAAVAPASTRNRPRRIANNAAMKKVLSPNSLTKMSANAAVNPLFAMRPRFTLRSIMNVLDPKSNATNNITAATTHDKNRHLKRVSSRRLIRVVAHHLHNPKRTTRSLASPCPVARRRALRSRRTPHARDARFKSRDRRARVRARARTPPPRARPDDLCPFARATTNSTTTTTTTRARARPLADASSRARSHRRTSARRPT